ncbi:MAG: YceI family protein [Streptosporangiaceae bacterium]|nr:YceI family protein [Streptosporangiaceae bacterium]MBV9854256.1 YceI family protein [Streptosporangiaceae bacterium]
MAQYAPDSVPASAPAPGTYTLDPEGTTIRADVKAMFGLMTVRGAFRLKAGEISIAADPAASSVRATIDAGSFASGNATRDSDVISASLLDAAAYPEITFSGQGARPEGTGWVMSGSVTAHGITQPAEVRIGDARSADGIARFQVTASLDRTSFGITKKKGLVGRGVALVIEAVTVAA